MTKATMKTTVPAMESTNEEPRMDIRIRSTKRVMPMDRKVGGSFESPKA